MRVSSPSPRSTFMALQPTWMPAPSRVNWLACSYTVTSMPTRRRAAAVARPPMPPPTIATESCPAIASPDLWRGPLSRLCRSESRPRQCRTSLLRRQRVEKGLDRRPLLARLNKREIIMLFGQRNETEAGCMGDRRDRHAPVGAMLRYSRRDRIMRAWLIPIAVRPRIAEQPVDQNAGARALVAVDHDAGGIGERCANRLLCVSAFETHIALAEHDALHPPPAGHQFEPVGEERRV